VNAYPEDTDLIQRLVRHVGTNPANVAKRAGVAVSTVNRPFNGTAHNRLGRSVLDKLKAAFPDFPGWDGGGALSDRRLPFNALPSAHDDDSLSIPMLELAYGMGGTFLEGHDPELSFERFPRAFVRMFTATAPDQLCFAYGIGDSMEPTITDRDMLLIDRSRTAIRVSDQIWVVASGGIGMVKRVRVAGGQVWLLSDNTAVPDYPVADDELTIIGRVVAVVKKV